MTPKKPRIAKKQLSKPSTKLPPYEESAKYAAVNGAQNGFNRLLDPDTCSNLINAPQAGALSTGDAEANLAAQQLEHLLAAYKYASQAISAASMGHTKTAVHLAYYSELRAAISLYAACSISTQSDFYLGANGTYKQINVGKQTHTFAWNLWSLWKDRRDAKDIFSSLKISPSVSLHDFAKSLSITGRLQSTLGKWDYDLLSLSKNDHEARKISSYQATDIYTGMQSHLEIDALANLSQLLLLEGNSGYLSFEKFYAQWILHSLADAYAKLEVHDKGANYGAEYSTYIANSLARVARDTGESVDLLSGLLTPSSENIAIYSVFEKSQEQNTALINILSRMTILLRLATHKLNSNLSATASKSRSGHKWLRKWLDHLGILEIAVDDGDVADEEGEFRFAVTDLAGLATTTGTAQQTAQTALKVPELAKLIRTETVLCWAVDFV
jgi:hypothetical protein